MLGPLLVATLGASLAVQNAEPSPLKQVQDLQLRRTQLPISWAEYVVEARKDRGQEVYGRSRIRCYKDGDESYFVEEIDVRKTSRVWIFRDRMVLRWSERPLGDLRMPGLLPGDLRDAAPEPPREHVVVGPITATSLGDHVLEAADFPDCRMSAMDRTCHRLAQGAMGNTAQASFLVSVLLVPPVECQIQSDGFEFKYGLVPAVSIVYRVAEGLPPWKAESDAHLHEIEDGGIAVSRLEQPFSFPAAMEVSLGQETVESPIALDELRSWPRKSGFLIPVAAEANIQSATYLKKVRWLRLVVHVGQTRLDILQGHREFEWNGKGQVTNLPFPSERIAKSKRFAGGQLLLVTDRRGFGPETIFCSGTGHMVWVVGDVFDDPAFQRLIKSLRGPDRLSE